MAFVKLENISFAYAGNAKAVLDLPNLQVSSGERVFLHGPSGTGKTTLLEILAGVLVPQRGSVNLLDQDLTAMTASARDRFRSDHIGYIFQSFNLIPYLNVEENISLPLHFSSVRSSRVREKNAHAEIRRLTEALGIGDLLARPVTELSVGQQQRVAAARALIGAPELLLADEPTSALDTDHREMFLKLLFAQAQAMGTTVLFVSHDRSIQHLFDRTLSLRELQGGGK